MRKYIMALLTAAVLLPLGCKSGSEESSEASGPVKYTADRITDSLEVSDRIIPEAEAYKAPRFIGRESSTFPAWVAKKLSYPKAAADSLQSGTVIINFVIDKKGKLVCPKVVQSVSHLLDSAALAAVCMSPFWAPGENEQGEPVQVSYDIPVNFTLR